MRRKNQLHACLAALALGFGMAAVAAEKPNILFIAVDDLRPELNCYGKTQIKSPNIDQLASEGTLFGRAYCAVPVCGASRANLMTGILPTPTRFVAAGTHIDKDTPGATTLPQLFKEAGYVTLSNGKVLHTPEDTQERSWSEAVWRPGPKDQPGFDPNLYSIDPKTREQLSSIGRGAVYEMPDVADDQYPDGQTALKTIQDLRRLKEGGKPFFLACGFLRPHLPFYAPKKYWDLYDRETLEIADHLSKPERAPKALKGSTEYASYHQGEYEVGSEAWHRMMRHGYYASVSYADQLVGQVLAELETLGLAENTIVVLWGDHGWQLGEHGFWGKHNTMHLSLRVPLIIKIPGKSAGQKTMALVETGDLYPTLCELAGLTVPASVQGKSMLKLLDQPEQPFREVIYSRFRDGDAVVTRDFAYTSFGAGGHMLYDHRKDPGENTNVADLPEYRETLQTMQKLLKARMAESESSTYSSTKRTPKK